MAVKRRTPGQRRRRSRREDELRQVSELYPERVDDLLELRRYNPQAYRKELVRLVKLGRIMRGRGVLAADEILALLDSDLPALQRAVEAGLEAGDHDFRTLMALRQEEKGARARPDFLGWLQTRLQALLDAENRDLP